MPSYLHDQLLAPAQILQLLDQGMLLLTSKKVSRTWLSVTFKFFVGKGIPLKLWHIQSSYVLFVCCEIALPPILQL